MQVDTHDALVLTLEVCDRLDRVIALQESQLRALQRLAAAIDELPHDLPPATGNGVAAMADPFPVEPDPVALGRLIPGRAAGVRSVTRSNGIH